MSEKKLEVCVVSPRINSILTLSIVHGESKRKHPYGLQYCHYIDIECFKFIARLSYYIAQRLQFCGP